MFRFRSVTAALAVILVAAPLAAQNVSQVVVPEVAVAAPAPAVPVATAVAEAAPASQAPLLSNATAGIRSAPRASLTPAPAPQDGSVGRNPAMMIVGGVALIAGAVIGGESGTIIMIGGGLLGLYGLWQYLK